ncbi:hypothetical protein KSZ98_21710, partial [Phocaeicola vulgatus]|nr:hypothetical protein [Phocaeicola vulgatus]
FVIVKFLLPKDTKSLGNNKAPACESRGFVRKKQKVCILTHLLLSVKKNNFPCSPTTYGKLKLFSYQYIKKIKYT